MLSPERSSWRFRPRLFLSGLIGLVAGGLLAAGSVWGVTQNIIPILLPLPLVALVMTILFGAVSLAEIPMMIYTMRRLVVERPTNHGFVLGLNALFVFFAAVYALPVLLLTGSLGWGLALFCLSIVRFAASMAFVQPPAEQPSPQSKQEEQGDPDA